MLSLLCCTFVDEILSYIEVSLNEENSSSHTQKKFIVKNSLELRLKSVEHEIYILHSHNIVYPWPFAGDNKPLCEQLPKIGPYRPCLYTCELVSSSSSSPSFSLIFYHPNFVWNFTVQPLETKSTYHASSQFPSPGDTKVAKPHQPKTIKIKIKQQNSL